MVSAWSPVQGTAATYLKVRDGRYGKEQWSERELHHIDDGRKHGEREAVQGSDWPHGKSEQVQYSGEDVQDARCRIRPDEHNRTQRDRQPVRHGLSRPGP